MNPPFVLKKYICYDIQLCREGHNKTYGFSSGDQVIIYIYI